MKLFVFNEETLDASRAFLEQCLSDMDHIYAKSEVALVIDGHALIHALDEE